MSRPHRRIQILACVALGFCVCLALTASGQPSPPSFSLRDGAVVDRATGTVFLMVPEGDVEAVSATDGRRLWRESPGGRPLALVDGLLLVQGGAPPGTVLERAAVPKDAGAKEASGSERLEVLLLAASDGRPRSTAAQDLPSGVLPLIDDRLEDRFRIEAHAAQGGSVLLSWSYEARSVRALPPEEGESTGGRTITGRSILQVDAAELRSGAGEVPQALPPDLRPEEGIEGVSGRQFRSADGLHILVSERASDDREWEKYRWTLYDRETGERLGAIRSASSWTPFCVIGEMVIHELRPVLRRVGDEVLQEPLSLRAVALRGGGERWRRAVRDTEYRGPFPP